LYADKKPDCYKTIKLLFKMTAIYAYINEYFNFVADNTEKKGDLDEYLEEDFKFVATNNWKEGFDIVDWLIGQGKMKTDYKAFRQVASIDMLLTVKETCEICTRIMTYYEGEYDNAYEVFGKDITPESVVRHLAYVVLDEMELKDLKTLLGLEDSEEEEEKEIPWCYEGNKNAVCNCFQPCSPPSEEEEELDGDGDCDWCGNEATAGLIDGQFVCVECREEHFGEEVECCFVCGHEATAGFVVSEFLCAECCEHENEAINNAEMGAEDKDVPRPIVTPSITVISKAQFANRQELRDGRLWYDTKDHTDLPKMRKGIQDQLPKGARVLHVFVPCKPNPLYFNRKNTKVPYKTPVCVGKDHDGAYLHLNNYWASDFPVGNAIVVINK
jgi:hypothetical protein